MGLSGKGYDRSGLCSFNWDPPCSRVSNLKGEGIDFICTIRAERVGDLLRFHSSFEGRDLMGEVSHRCIVKGENPYNWYKGLELIAGAMDKLVNWGDRVAILSSSCPETILRPIVPDTKSHDLLLAMTRLSRKVKGKIIMSNNRELLDKYMPKQPGGGGRMEQCSGNPSPPKLAGCHTGC